MQPSLPETHGLVEYTETLQKSAIIAQDPLAFESLPLLNDADQNALRREITHKWDQAWRLFYLVVMCTVAAAGQGMDESVINGANLFFPAQFVGSGQVATIPMLWYTGVLADGTVTKSATVPV
ncbi:hypothetical protein LXA43DRAFT_1102127 [Ganoderma leucocontextum]|nr:hypothetical protein LXA43DRAFT_1102127 [Ganoderma leucocontextum]